MIIAPVAAFEAKTFIETQLMKSYLVGGKRSIFAVQPNENTMVKYLSNHMACVFYKFHIGFFYLPSKKQTHCTYVG